jgi:hypothetical protein
MNRQDFQIALDRRYAGDDRDIRRVVLSWCRINDIDRVLFLQFQAGHSPCKRAIDLPSST